MIKIKSRKYYSQFVNGITFGSNLNDFTNFLLANIGEKIKLVEQIECYWQTIGSQYSNEFTTTSTTDYINIIRANGSFIDDGFNNGDTVIQRYWDGYAWQNRTGTITSLTDTEMDLYIPGILPSPTYSGIYQMQLYGVTPMYGMEFKFNLIENSQAPVFNSLVDNNEQLYYVEDIGTGSPRSTIPVTGRRAGVYSSWHTDDELKVSFVASDSNPPYGQTFEISYEFRITPFFLAEHFSDLINQIPPEYFLDLKCLKPIYYYELRQNLYNPNIIQSLIDEGNKGNTGWFNSYFNDFLPKEFSKDSIIYFKSGVQQISIQYDSTTHVRIIINSANNVFNNNTKFTLNHIFLPLDESLYINTSSDMFQNYVFDTYFGSIGIMNGTGNYGILKNISSRVNNSKLEIDFDISFTLQQQLNLKDGYFILWVTTQSDSLGNANSNRIAVLCDVNKYIDKSDVDGGNASLLSWNQVKFYEHLFNHIQNPGNGTCNYKGWITDGIFNYIDFTTKTGILNSVNLKYRVRNIVTGQQFTLQDFIINCTGFPVINKIRTASINTTRNYKLAAGNIRNYVKLDMGTTSGSNQQYILQIGSKLRWEDYIALLQANTDFYDINKLNNGLNYKWDNYFNKVNWKPEIIIEIKVEDYNGLQTIFENRSDVEIYDWFKDNNTTPLWNCELELFENNVSTGKDSAALISKNTDTKVKITYTCSPLNPIVSTNIYGIIFIEEYQEGGELKQYQLSSVENPLTTGNPLYPLAGQTKAKVTIVNTTTLTVECMIDKTKINKNKTYSIFGRIGNGCSPVIGVVANATLELTTSLIRIIQAGNYVTITLPDVGELSLQYKEEPLNSDIAEFVRVINESGTTYTAVYDSEAQTIIFYAPGTGTQYNGEIITFVIRQVSDTYDNPIGSQITITLNEGVTAIDCEGNIPDVSNLLKINPIDFLKINLNDDKLNINK